MGRLSSFLVFLFIFSCEEVIDLDLVQQQPRLIIDAIIRVDRSQEFVPIEVKVSLTTSYFNENEPASLDTAYIYYGKEENGDIINSKYSYLAEQEPGTGVYIPDPDSPTDQRINSVDITEDTTFYLVIEFEGKTYFSKTKFIPTVPLDNVEQGSQTLFEDEIEIIVTFTDDANREDFYLFDYSNGNYIVSEDKFYQGQEFSFSYFYEDPVEIGDELEIKILGADRSFYNYMFLFLQQTEGSFGFFETPAATIRGNIYEVSDIENPENTNNIQNPDANPLGYFAVIQEYKKTLKIE
ncbi:DUF4249 domain-containing protein [Aegicerativicinus sediminis]|uniref:DUF4249 domain-containing protein n=1 Tax=Aegicerativicinus sediminis TaxID=2893202 RepID=UPI001E51609E|nr:DUF4249 domain-containing protein [Aegicerativicinus sediminis]